MSKVKIYTDGASRGNPGPASYAYILTDSGGDEIHRDSGFIGQATNNLAEYTAVFEALKKAKEIDSKEVEIYSDSRLVVNQLKGNWKVKSENLKDLYSKSTQLINGFKEVILEHVPRENRMVEKADRMCNKKLDSKNY